MIEYKKCGIYCNRWEPTCELFNPITKECVYDKNRKKLCENCLYTDEEIKEIKKVNDSDFNQ